MEHYQKFAAKNWLARCKDLTPTEKLLWLILNDYQGGKAFCFPSQETLAHDIGFSDVSSVEKHVKSLADRMYVVRKRVGTHAGRKNRNYYSVTIPAEWDHTRALFLEALSERRINPAEPAGSVSRYSSGEPSRYDGGVYSSYRSDHMKGRRVSASSRRTSKSQGQRLHDSGHLESCVARRACLGLEGGCPMWIDEDGLCRTCGSNPDIWDCSEAGHKEATGSDYWHIDDEV